MYNPHNYPGRVDVYIQNYHYKSLSYEEMDDDTIKKCSFFSNFMAFSGVAGLRSFKSLHGGISPFSLRKRRVAKTGFLIFVMLDWCMLVLYNGGSRRIRDQNT